MIYQLKALRALLKKLPLNQQLIFTGVAVGIAAGVSAFLFERLIGFSMRLSTAGLDQLPPHWRVIGMIAIPAIGGIVAGVITHVYCPDAKGHGVPEVMTAINERDGHIRSRVMWSKALASAATLGTGGSTGREGPIVQIGAAVGSALGRFLDVSRDDLRTLVAAGAAGGLGAAFSVPLASVFFVMEVILRNFANEAFPAIVISSVMATATARILLGSSAFFTPVSYQWRHPIEFAYYALLGFICAPVGVFYRRSIDEFERVFSKMTLIPDWVRPAIGGALLGALALILPDVRGTGQDLLNEVLLGRMLGWGFAALALGKIIATSLTLGSGGCGGALMPSIFVGGMMGGFFGLGLQYLFGPSVEVGALILVGMAGVFTSAFQAPITAIVMIFEITHDYGVLTPVMFGCIISFIFSRNANVDHSLKTESRNLKTSATDHA